MKLLVCVIVALLAVGAVEARRKGERSVQRIEGGEDVGRGELPFLVSLQDQNADGDFVHYCTGVLVSPIHVLTSGSCVDWDGPGSLLPDRLVVNAYDLDDFGGQEQIFTAVGGGFPPRYGLGRHNNNDLALIGLNAAVQNIEPITLFNPATGVGLEEVGATLTVAGWNSGNTVRPERNNAPEDKPESTTLEVMSNAVCDEILRGIGTQPVMNANAGPISSSMLCASDDDRGICTGDGGLPLFTTYNDRFFLIGIASWSDSVDCLGGGTPSIFSRVSPVFDWFLSFTAGAVAHGPNTFGSGSSVTTAPFVNDFWDQDPTAGNTFSCSNEVIREEFVCDGVKDCVDYGDESVCACGKGEYACNGSKFGYCIPVGWFCDGIQDCPNGEDESGCHGSGCDQWTVSRPGDYTCPHPNFCPDGTTCRDKTCVAIADVNQCCDHHPVTWEGDRSCYNPLRPGTQCSRFPGRTCRDFYCVAFDQINTCPGTCDPHPLTPPGDNTCTTLCPTGYSCRNTVCENVHDINQNTCCDDLPIIPRGDGSCNTNQELNCADFDDQTCRDHWCLEVDVLNRCNSGDE